MRAFYLTAAVVLVAAVAAASGCTPNATPVVPTVPSGSSAGAPQGEQQPNTSTEATAQAPATTPGASDKLKIVDTKVGTGPAAKTGDNVTVDYTGWLTNGTKFDSSVDRNQPFTFPLGGGQVIPGWDQGVVGMKVGGVRRLTIPPALGYGAQGAGGAIPPNATLVFEIKLLKIN